MKIEIPLLRQYTGWLIWGKVPLLADLVDVYIANETLTCGHFGFPLFSNYQIGIAIFVLEACRRTISLVFILGWFSVAKEVLLIGRNHCVAG